MHWIRAAVFLTLITCGGIAEQTAPDNIQSGAVLANYDKDRSTPIYIEKNLFTLKKNTSLLVFGDLSDEEAVLVNTGYSVEVRLETNATDLCVFGEALGNYLFVYTRTIFYWAENADGNAGTEIIGKKNTALEVSVIFYNTKYASYKKALQEKDGILDMRFCVDTNSDENKKFESFAEKMKKIEESGSSTKISLEDDNSWYLDFENTPYYAYPGSMTNVSTDTTEPCAIVIVAATNLKMSKAQFDNAFSKMKSKSGSELVTKQKTYEQDSRPILNITEAAMFRFTIKGYVDPLYSDDGY